MRKQRKLTTTPRSKPKHSDKPRAENEWYVEPSWCVNALATVERFSHVYDPACGCGTIPKAFAELGIAAQGADIVDRGFGKQRDFLVDDLPFAGGLQIVCNPPYLRGEGTISFIERALDIGFEKSCFIVNESFLFSRRRMTLFERWPLIRMWLLSDRPSMPPGDLLASGAIEAKGGTANYVWLVFDPKHTGSPACGWIGNPSLGPPQQRSPAKLGVPGRATAL